MKFAFLFFFFSMAFYGQNKFEVFFDFNKDNPNTTSITQLNEWIKSKQVIEVDMIYGYSDSVDENSYNKELSSRRINSVVEVLQINAVSISKNLIKKPFGEDFVLEKDQSKNRKVTIFYHYLDDKNDLVKEKSSDNQTLIQKIKKAKKGDNIQLFDINFQFNSEKISLESEQIVLDLFEALYKYPKLRIEIQGHMCCNPNKNDVTLSYRRAKYIFDFLIKHGIGTERLAYRGFGTVRPIYPIPEKNETEEKMNRRVELLILETI